MRIFRRVATIVLITVISTSAVAVGADVDGEVFFNLELHPMLRTVRLGQTINIDLRITGPGLAAIFKAGEGVEVNAGGSDFFKYTFKFRPQREGDFIVGPYALTFNGIPLESQPLYMQVLPAWDGPMGTFFRIDRDDILLGQSIELIVETWTQTNARPQRLSPRRTPTFDYTMGPSMTHMQMEAGGERITSYLRAWYITPKQVGHFRINAETFEDLPDGIEPPDFLVTVREEPGQAENEAAGGTVRKAQRADLFTRSAAKIVSSQQ